MDKSFLIDDLLHRLQNNPSKICLEFNEQQISNAQLLNATLILAEKLSKIGIQQGMLIAVLLNRSPEALVSLLALWKLGAVYIPLDSEHPTARLDYICQDVKPAFVITQQSLSEKLNTIPHRQIQLQTISFTEGNLSTPYSIDSSNNKIEPEKSLAYVLYTSGSSGQPKGVEISQHSLSSLLSTMIPLLELDESDTFLGLANFSFDIAFFELLTPFLIGAKLFLLDKDTYNNPKVISQFIAEKEITVIQTTPSLWQLINHFSWNTHSRKVKAISTGEALPLNTAKNILSNTDTLWNLYGPSECTIWASAKKLTLHEYFSEDKGYVSIGSPLPGYEFHLSDHTNKSELQISGSGLALAYHSNPQLTDEKFVFIESPTKKNKRRYLSGDICSCDNNNEFYFHGRADNQVKLNGYRIELEEIEKSLESHPSIKHALTSVRELGGSSISVLLAYIVYEDGMPNKTADRLNAFLEKNLPHYMLPQRYFFLNELALNSNGKKDRNYLPDVGEIFEVNHSPPILTSESENSIAEIFCEVLDIKKIGLYDSFFDVGGNSMLAASLVMAVNNKFESQVSLKEALLSPPTVNSIHQLIKTPPNLPSNIDL